MPVRPATQFAPAQFALLTALTSLIRMESSVPKGSAESVTSPMEF